MGEIFLQLEKAWKWREQRGILVESEAIRIFHGPGEGLGALKHISIDKFGSNYWVTEWEAKQKTITEEIINFLISKNAHSAVMIQRPEKGLPPEPVKLLGEPPTGRFEVKELDAKFLIQLIGSRQPGLFLDHAPLRQWLRVRARSWRVLNTFAFTGSLSVAAALGGAEHVTTLDLSKSAIGWAQENWALNGLDLSRAQFIAGDVFEWLPKFHRQEAQFDCVILDPPSFARGVKGTFSTSNDLKRLHDIAIPLIAPGGVLVTSINSAKILQSQFEQQVLASAKDDKRYFEILWRIDLPETFPTTLGAAEERYLKGLVLRLR